MVSVKDEVVLMASQKFGPNSAKRFEALGERIDPEANPKGYLDACVDLLSKVLGPTIARRTFEPLYGKYGG
jgi:hypothetical protein